MIIALLVVILILLSAMYVELRALRRQVSGSSSPSVSAFFDNLLTATMREKRLVAIGLGAVAVVALLLLFR